MPMSWTLLAVGRNCPASVLDALDEAARQEGLYRLLASLRAVHRDLVRGERRAQQDEEIHHHGSGHRHFLLCSWGFPVKGAILRSGDPYAIRLGTCFLDGTGCGHRTPPGALGTPLTFPGARGR